MQNSSYQPDSKNAAIPTTYGGGMGAVGGGVYNNSSSSPHNHGHNQHHNNNINNNNRIAISNSSTLPVDPHHAAETAIMARLLKQSQQRTKDLHNECEDLHNRGEEMYSAVLEHQQQVVMAEKRVLAVEREKDELKSHYEGELLKVRTAFSDFDTQINAYIRTLEDSHKAEIEQLKKEAAAAKEASAKEREILRAAAARGAQEEGANRDRNAPSSSVKNSMMMMLSPTAGGDAAERMISFREERDGSYPSLTGGSTSHTTITPLTIGDTYDADFEEEGDGFVDDGGDGGGRWISDRDLKGLVQQLERYRDVTRGHVVPDSKLAHQHQQRNTPTARYTDTSAPATSTTMRSSSQPRVRQPRRDYYPQNSLIERTGNAASPMPLSIDNNNSYSRSFSSINEHQGNRRGDYNKRASTPPSGIRRNAPTTPTGRQTHANNNTASSSSSLVYQSTPSRTIVGGPAAVEERLRLYREDLQKSTSVKRSLADYKVRVAQEQESKRQYEASHSLLPKGKVGGAEGADGVPLEDNNGVLQSRLQRFLVAEGDDVTNRNGGRGGRKSSTTARSSRRDSESNSKPPSIHGSSRRRRRHHQRSSSSNSSNSLSSYSGTGSSSSSSSTGGSSSRQFTLEEREEEGDVEYGQLASTSFHDSHNNSHHRRTVSTLSSLSEDEEDDELKKERRRQRKQAKKLRRKLAYEKAVMRYDEHKKQEGFYADTYGARAGGGTPRNIQKSSSSKNPTARQLEDRRDGPAPIHMFNLPAESYFGDVETDGSGGGGGGRRGVTTPRRSTGGYHPPPPPRVMQPTIATPTRRDNTPSRVPLVDHKRQLPSSTTTAATSHPNPTAAAAYTPHSQIHRGNSGYAAAAPHSSAAGMGRRTGSPFEHRDRSIL